MSSIYRKSDFFVVQPFGTYLLLNSSSIIKNLIKAGEDVRWNEQIFYSATYFDADQINCFARLINFDVSEIVVHQLNTDHRVTKTEMRMEIEIKSKEDSLLFIGLRTKFNIDNSLISTRIHCGNQVGEFAHFLKRIMKKVEIVICLHSK